MSRTAPITAILAGPTGSGKSALALELCEAAAARGVAVEIVNADSVSVYRGLDIGSAKPTAAERAHVPHHLIDIRDPLADGRGAYTAGDFAADARAAIADIHARGARALVVGGTGFYLKALTHGMWETTPPDPALRARLEALPSEELVARLRALDPPLAAKVGAGDRYRLVRALEIWEATGRSPREHEAAHREVRQAADGEAPQAGQLRLSRSSGGPEASDGSHLRDSGRLPGATQDAEITAPHGAGPEFELWVIDRPRDELRARVDQRARQMLAAGLVDEVRALRARYPGARALGAVGYRQVALYLDGVAPPGGRGKPGDAAQNGTLAAEIALATRQLIKAQRTWFRAQPAAQRFTLDADRGAVERAFAALYLT